MSRQTEAPRYSMRNQAPLVELAPPMFGRVRARFTCPRCAKTILTESSPEDTSVLVRRCLPTHEWTWVQTVGAQRDRP